VPRDKRNPKAVGYAPWDWGIVVRQADGTWLYYIVDKRNVDSQGKPIGRWSHRVSDAYRFPFEEDARRVAAALPPGPGGQGYTVVPLPPSRPV